MNFIEQDLLFNDALSYKESDLASKSFSAEAEPILKGIYGEAEILGVRVRLGNRPIVTNLRKLLERVHDTLPPKMEMLFREKDVYTIVHAIGVTRTKGKAKVDELHYDAEMIDENGLPLEHAQTRDLIPHTRFREVLKANVNFEGGLSVTGNAMASIPEELTKDLLPEYVSIGGAMNLQLSKNVNFAGKFVYSLKFPVVISTGIASNTCHWVLTPDEEQTPLLGDQLLVQTTAVPRGLDKIRFKIKGTVKVDRGLFFKQQVKETDVHELEVTLR